MSISITVKGQPRPDGSVVRFTVELDVGAFDEHTASRLVDAARQCHQAVQSTTGNQTRATAENQSFEQPSCTSSTARLATEKQVRAIHAMAARQGIDLKDQLHDRFSVSSVKALTISQASGLIDQLKNNLQSA